MVKKTRKRTTKKRATKRKTTKKKVNRKQYVRKRKKKPKIKVRDGRSLHAIIIDMSLKAKKHGKDKKYWKEHPNRYDFEGYD